MDGMDHSHAVHDHSAHSADAASLEGPIPHPMHGGWLGHMLPGWFFFGWATWWLVGLFRAYMASSGKAPYSARAWYDFPWGKRLPLEPILKVVLTFIGINGELWFGHESWRSVLLRIPRWLVRGRVWGHAFMQDPASGMQDTAWR